MEVVTRYARSGELEIAYQVSGAGPLDLVLIPAFLSNIELAWDVPDLGRFLHRLGSFSRLIRYDRRGCGMSDRPTGAAPLEEHLDDVLVSGTVRHLIAGSGRTLLDRGERTLKGVPGTWRIYAADG